MRKWKKPIIFEIYITDDRLQRIKIPYSYRIWCHLKVLELSIELGFEHLSDTLRTAYRVGKLSLLVCETKCEVFMFEDLRESFEKSLKYSTSRAVCVVDTDERSF